MTSESGFSWLSWYAREYVEKLRAELDRETNRGLRCWLLELIGIAKDQSGLDLFAGYLKCGDDSFRFWAIAGMRELDTAEARRIMSEAGVRD